MKPKIRQMQKFANPYFKLKDRPLIRWKAKKGVLGSVDVKNRVIYINPVITIAQALRCFITDNYFTLQENIAFFEGEQYFAVLLFQINQFKIGQKNSSYKYENLREHIKTEQWVLKAPGKH